MANTKFIDLLPFIFIGAIIYFSLIFLIFKYLPVQKKWESLFGILVYIGITIFLINGYLQNDPWAQILWMLGFFFHNFITWIILLLKYYRLRK